MFRCFSFRLILLAGLAFATGACDTARDVADAVNPMQLFEDDEEESIEPKPVPGEEAPYPTIGAVPERPARPAIATDAEIMRRGLVADKENAQYTDEIIRQDETPPPAARSREQALSVPPPEPPSASVPPPPPPPRAVVPPQPSASSAVQSTPTVDMRSTPPANQVPPMAAVTPAPAASQPQAESRTQAERPPPAETRRPTPEPQRAATPPPSAAPIAGNDGPTRQAAAGPRQVATIFFPNGGSRLNASDRQILAQVAQLYRTSGAQSIQLVGHASATGTGGDPANRDMANYKASLDRATAAASELLAVGVPRDALKIGAVGARQPRFSEDNPNGVAGNQRVEIYFLN